MTHLATPASPARRLPAWLMSLVVHGLALVVLALAVRTQPASPPAESPREVGIALVVRQQEQPVDYFDESDAPRDTQAAAPSAPSASPPAANLATALPAPGDAAANLLPPNTLPKLPGGRIGDVEIASMRVTPLRKQPLFAGADDAAILAEEAARREGKGPKGPRTEVGIFGAGKAVGNSFVFVIDRSKSMGGDGLGALDAAEQELTAALSRLGPEHRFQVIAYHQQPVYVGARRLLDATPENKAAMQEFFDGLLAYGGTQHETALLAALRLEPDVVFLLTDGGDPYLNEAEIDYITRRAEGRTAVHCIQFGFGPTPRGGDFMQRLASRNRGSYGYVDMSAWRMRGK
ncbi:MAG: VWA domain-containing protein [Pirellulaceae bacterium]